MSKHTDFGHEDFIEPEEAGRILRVKPGTLAVWRSTKRYPLPYYKSGRWVLYRRSECLEFLKKRRVSFD